jgi:hypothetical protein
MKQLLFFPELSGPTEKAIACVIVFEFPIFFSSSFKILGPVLRSLIHFKL